MRICIVGGGVIGLFSAYYLVQTGHEVTIVDQYNFDQGTSYGNAGMICPSHFTPLAAPGVIRQSLKWMFDNTSPFYLKPRLDKNFMAWGWQFFKHCNRRHVQHSMGPLSALLTWSRSLYLDLAGGELDFEVYPKGIIMTCNSNHGLTEEINLAKKAKSLGISTQVLTPENIKEINPGVQFKTTGGVHYLDDMHLVPQKLMQALIHYLKDKVQWKPNSEVRQFIHSNQKTDRIITSTGEISADVYLLAAGTWTGDLARKAGAGLYLEGGKGYNITIEQVQPQLQTPLILVEGRVAVTPMGDSLRLGGTMELAGLNNKILPGRINGILKTIETYLPDFKTNSLLNIKPWFGFRPLSPTGMPIITKLNPLKNVYVNTGHGMLGLSLAPASGHLIEQMINNHHPA